MLRIVATLLFLANATQAALADVNVEQFQVVRATLTAEDAQQWTQAFGLRETLTQKAQLDSIRSVRLEAAVQGNYSANGTVRFHHQGLVQMISPAIEGNVAQVEFQGREASLLYSALKGIREIPDMDGTGESFAEKKLTLSNLQVRCRVYPTRANPEFACQIQIGL